MHFPTYQLVFWIPVESGNDIDYETHKQKFQEMKRSFQVKHPFEEILPYCTLGSIAELPILHCIEGGLGHPNFRDTQTTSHANL